jgi:hypothetical protein
MTEPAIEAIQVCRRLCQMASDAGLPAAAQQRLLFAMAALCASTMLKPDLATWFKDAVVGFLNTFVAVTKTVDDLTARLQPTRPASALPAALAGLRGSRLFRALMALDLPATTTEIVHLEVALVAQRLVQQDALHGITRIYEKIVNEGNTRAAFDIDVKTAAFLCRRLTLDALVQKHIDLADAAAAAAAAAAGPAN